MKRFLTGAWATALASLFLIYSKEVFGGISTAVNACVSVAVPSLFPMLFICAYMCECGAVQTLGAKIAPVFSRLFSLPGEAAAVFLICILGGYPAGASMCAALYETGAISRQSARWLVTVCVCAGPGFLLSTVGAVYFGSIRSGIILFAAQVLSLVAVCFIVKRPVFEPAATSHLPPACENAFVRAAARASGSMMNVCIYIVLFGALTAVFDCSGLLGIATDLLSLIGLPPATARALLLSIAEVTTGCAYASKCGYAAAGFAVGFGGLAVHFQIYAIAENIKVSRMHFTAIRLTQGLICSFFAWLLSHLITTNEVVQASALTVTRALPDVTGSVFLLLLCAMFVLCAPQINHQSSHP